MHRSRLDRHPLGIRPSTFVIPLIHPLLLVSDDVGSRLVDRVPRSRPGLAYGGAGQRVAVRLQHGVRSGPQRRNRADERPPPVAALMNRPRQAGRRQPPEGWQHQTRNGWGTIARYTKAR